VEVLIIVTTLPLALVSGFWLLSARLQPVGRGHGRLIALGGVAVEIGIVMLTYLDRAQAPHRRARQKLTHATARGGNREPCCIRPRP
jgi:Cu(I)/Ag(I) efflux system membrane protein CusA/SilA